MDVDKLKLAAEATLLFHSGSPWDDAKKYRWQLFAETLLGIRPNMDASGRLYDATTRVLCDMQREALK